MRRAIAGALLLAAHIYAGGATGPKHDGFRARRLCVLPPDIPYETTWRWPAVSPDGRHFGWVEKQPDGRWIAMVDGRPRFTPHPDI